VRQELAWTFVSQLRFLGLNLVIPVDAGEVVQGSTVYGPKDGIQGIQQVTGVMEGDVSGQVLCSSERVPNKQEICAIQKALSPSV